MHFVKILFPSQNNEVASLNKYLIWGYRIYYIYSYLVFLLIRYQLVFLINLNPNWLLVLFMLEAAFLFYIFQSYRRFFTISDTIKKNFRLKAFFFFWIIIFLLFNIFQIVVSPVLIAGIEIRYDWMFTVVPFILWISGELLFKKIK